VPNPFCGAVYVFPLQEDGPGEVIVVGRNRHLSDDETAWRAGSSAGVPPIEETG